MILVNCVWRHEDIIRNIEALEYKGVHLFKHVKTDGMRMYFDSKIEDMSREMDKSSFMEYMLIMKAISQISGWEALAISVLPVVNDSVFDGYKYTVCRSNKPIECQRLLK